MFCKQLIATSACVLAAAVALAVPSRLDKFHAPLTRIYHDFVRQETRVAANVPYVRSVVKYQPLKESPIWINYVRQLAYVDPVTLKSESEAGRKAFWINTYNSFVMDAVAQNYPLANISVNNYPTASFRASEAWETEHFAAGGSYTLEKARNILAQLRDPRALFALNDAAIASPALPDQPYDATNLEIQLDRAVENFLADPLNFRIDRRRNRIILSQVFKENTQVFRDSVSQLSPDVARYPSDQRAIVTFLLNRVRKVDRDYIISRKPMIEYGTFSWDVNVAQ